MDEALIAATAAEITATTEHHVFAPLEEKLCILPIGL